MAYRQLHVSLWSFLSNINYFSRDHHWHVPVALILIQCVNSVEIMIIESAVGPWNLQYMNLVEIMILLSCRPLESAICEFSADYDIVKLQALGNCNMWIKYYYSLVLFIFIFINTLYIMCNTLALDDNGYGGSVYMGVWLWVWLMCYGRSGWECGYGSVTTSVVGYGWCLWVCR